MRQKQKVFTQPKEEELVILGQLIKIEIYFSSFAVFWQLVSETNIPAQHQVYQTIYPLSELKRFFRVNSEENGYIFCSRPGEANWRMTK